MKETKRKYEGGLLVAGADVSDHFADVSKTIPMPKGAEKEVDNLLLTRYACYLIAQNGDSRKAEIAFAQTCFAASPPVPNPLSSVYRSRNARSTRRFYF